MRRQPVIEASGGSESPPLLIISAGASGGAYATTVVRQVQRVSSPIRAIVVCGRNQQLRDRDRGRQWFDQRSFRPSYRAPQRFRVAPYRAPPGFYSRSWSFGDRLPFGWFGSSYYLNFGSYGLPYPPIGAEWVRVGSDALLVDVWTGEVLSVYYGLFW